ncbi:MAG: Luciferase-like monooxygenase, partial [Mycobacterium sp.]|nr:Luciferase-like monooxygenase [Mycobacterium sp.]
MPDQFEAPNRSPPPPSSSRPRFANSTEPCCAASVTAVTINDGLVTPKPIQSPLPVWIGGWSDAALRRAAAYGTGWHSSGLSFAEL